MTISVFDIVLIILVVVLLALFIFMQWKKIKQKNERTSEIEAITNKYESEIDILRREINRQNYILADYQKSKTDSNHNLPRESSVEQPFEDNNLVGDLSLEIEKLMDEKRKFNEKNRKLWEQSIAIHKEKERIDQRKNEIEYQHKQLTDSIVYAKRIQTALLPSETLIDSCLHDYFILWKPRDIVSGDFYWVKQIGELVVIVVADCTGHGVPGSFMSALGIAFLNEIINRQKIIRSNEILEEMRLLVKTSLNQEGHAELSKDGMDMALCVLDKKNNRLFFSGANNPLYIYRTGQILEFDSTRNPIGVHLVEKKFNVHEVALESTDVCYLFTDGYTDMMGGVSDKKFTKQRFRNLLIDMNIKGLNMEKQKRFLDDTINNWLGEKFKQIDDILVLGFIP